jgi:hypothetical protein
MHATPADSVNEIIAAEATIETVELKKKRRKKKRNKSRTSIGIYSEPAIYSA